MDRKLSVALPLNKKTAWASSLVFFFEFQMFYLSQQSDNSFGAGHGLSEGRPQALTDQGTYCKGSQSSHS